MTNPGSPESRDFALNLFPLLPPYVMTSFLLGGLTHGNQSCVGGLHCTTNPLTPKTSQPTPGGRTGQALLQFTAHTDFAGHAQNLFSDHTHKTAKVSPPPPPIVQWLLTVFSGNWTLVKAVVPVLSF